MTQAIVRIFCLIFFIRSNSAATHPKVIGGSDTVIKHYPYLVSIRSFGINHNCGGSIISDRHILTAAHCVDGSEESFKNIVTIHSGVSSTDKKGNVHKILSVHAHPKFNISNEEEGFPHDIAVLTLKDPIVFNKYQQKINLPSHDVQNYQVAYLVGWGMTSRRDRSRTKKLQKLKVALLPSDKCGPLAEHKINPEQLCSFRSGTSGACHGDSGGPLVSDGVIVGIVSYGDTFTCADGVPDIYTNVFAYKDFIESIMNE